MKIGIIDMSSLKASEVKAAISAVNIQIKRDLGPAWSLKGSCHYISAKDAIKKSQKYDAVIFIKDVPDDGDEEYYGYHDKDVVSGRPYGYVFQAVSKEELGEKWTVTFSHEVCEILVNPVVNRYCIGPMPRLGRDVFHWQEVCDPVQAQTYKIRTRTGKLVVVSDFVLPLYFTPEHEKTDDEKLAPNNFLETASLKSFGLTKGGYCGFYDPKTGTVKTTFGSKEAQRKFEARKRFLKKMEISPKVKTHVIKVA